LLVRVVHRFLAPDHLHVPIFLATALVAFTLSNRLQPESGLVAVTVMGVALANQRLAPVKHVVEFKENLQVLLIGTLFIALGSRTDGATLTSAGWRARPSSLP
jgi:NhaP-type Na+/H+ or K+/H+ antiporter